MAELDDNGISLMTVEKEYPQTQYCTWVSLADKQLDRLIKFLQAAKKQQTKTKGKGKK